MEPPAQLRPELLVVGHVCRDLMGGQVALGGPAAFAAQAAACMGIRTAVVTMAPASFELMAPLREHHKIWLRAHPCAGETIFALDYSGPQRQITLMQRAPTLLPVHIPARWRSLPLAYVAPAIGECGADVLASLGALRVVVGAQGWLRATGRRGLLCPAVAPEMLDPPSNITAMVFSELDHPEAEALAQHVARRGVTVALTRGRDGATLLTHGATLHVPALPSTEVDPTGAGDVFGVVLALALHRGWPLLHAAERAAGAAARVVEGPGLGNLAADAAMVLA